MVTGSASSKRTPGSGRRGRRATSPPPRPLCSASRSAPRSTRVCRGPSYPDACAHHRGWVVGLQAGTGTLEPYGGRPPPSASLGGVRPPPPMPFPYFQGRQFLKSKYSFAEGIILANCRGGWGSTPPRCPPKRPPCIALCNSGTQIW